MTDLPEDLRLVDAILRRGAKLFPDLGRELATQLLAEDRQRFEEDLIASQQAEDAEGWVP